MIILLGVLILLLVIMLCLLAAMYIDYRSDCKKYGRELADIMRRRNGRGK